MSTLFGTRHRMSKDFEAWAETMNISKCPESVILWLDMHGYLFNPRIASDYNPEMLQNATQCCALMNSYSLVMEQRYRELKCRMAMEGAKDDI